MVFFMFGPSYKSWALGNNVWTYHKSLPLAAHQLFEDKRVNGSNIEWASIGLTGLVYFSCYQQRMGYGGLSIDQYAPRLSYRTENPNLVADTNVTPASMYNFGTRSVEYISFAPGGGWVITYSDKTVRVSMTGTFPNRFHELAAQYLYTRGHFEAQASQIRYVFFGESDSVIIVLWTGQTQSWGLPMALEEAISSSLLQGRILGKGTSLCQWDSRFYFAEFVSATGWQSYGATYAWNIWPNTPLTDVLIREVTDGTIPVSLTAAVSDFVFQPPPPRPGVPIPTPKTSSLAMPWLSAYEPSFRKQVEEFMSGDSPAKWKIIFENGEPYEGAGYVTREYAMAGLRAAANGIITSLASRGVEVKITENDLNKAWDFADENHDGKMNFEEFVHLFISVLFYAYRRSLDDGNAPNVTVASSASNAGYYQNQAVPETPASPPPAYTASTTSHSKPTTPSHGIIDNGTPNHSIVTEQKVDTPLICNYCYGAITNVAHRCSICENGDFAICQPCYSYRQTCPGEHTLSTTKIVASLDTQMNKMNLGGKAPGKSGPSISSSEGVSATRKQEEEQLKESLMASIVSEKPNVKWEDVAGLESAKEELQEAVVLPLKFPELFTGKRKARRGMLLYGPSGTGKSYLAKAIATEVDSTLFSISSGDVLSKWLGDSERLIKQLFALARQKKPSIIFIDEIDALCGSRDAPGSNPHMLGLKTELFVQMDGVGNDNDGVLLLGATNLPWTLDPAVRRRFQRKIYIPLPNEKARRQLFNISAKKWDVKLSKGDYVELGSLTDGFSGSDISNALQDALNVPIKKIQTSRYYKKVEENGKHMFTPCEKGDAGAVAMTWRDVPKSMLKESDVVREDIFSVLENVKASVMQEEITKYEEWTEQFGSEGA